jgi:sulfur carrier protein
MDISINGQLETFEVNQMTLLELLNQKQLTDRKGIAIAVDDQIIPISEWSNFLIMNSSNIIIIEATQGG